MYLSEKQLQLQQQRRAGLRESCEELSMRTNLKVRLNSGRVHYWELIILKHA